MQARIQSMLWMDPLLKLGAIFNRDIKLLYMCVDCNKTANKGQLN